MGPLLAGTFLIVIYIELGEVQPFRSTAGRGLTFISSDELRFWLAHWLVALPGLILMGVGLVEHLGPPVRRMTVRLLEMPARGWSLLASGYFALLAALAVVGRAVFLLGLPIADDERFAVFGARMILNGDWSVPILQPEGAFSQALTRQHAGMVSALEYPGSLLFRALSLATGLDALLYALLAASAGVAVAATAGRLWGRSGALVAAGLWLFSPMALTLSMTTHSHLVSRSFLAIVVWLYARLTTPSVPPASTSAPLFSPSRSPVRDGTLLALAGGLAFLARPLEATCVLLPLLVHVLATTRQDRRVRRAIPAAAAVSLAVLAFYAWYNLQTAGALFAPARAEGVVIEPPGHNPGHAAFLLAIMALGPAGSILAAIGLEKRPVLTALAAGVLLRLGLTLFYDDAGIHTVGPIHFSETLPALVLLAASGARRAWRALGRWRALDPLPATAGLVYVVAGLGIFTIVHGFGLRTHASNSALIYGTVAMEDIHDAVIVAEQPLALFEAHSILQDTGSWVRWLPPPDPYLRDDVLYANAEADLDAVRARFPERTFYRMTYHEDAPPVRIALVE
jgi:4-amino-4-deoxy-L-arabinose transferase-like glycosyltransferase